MRILLTYTIFTLTLLCGELRAYSQTWINVTTGHEEYMGRWNFPYRTDNFIHFDFDEYNYLKMHRVGESDTVETYIPFSTDFIDSLWFSDELTEYGKDKYRTFAINITTADFDTLTCYYHNPDFPNENGARQDWYSCYVSVDGMGEYPSVSGTARVRGRGNSSWRWYPKKPMKIKFDEKTKVLGMGKAKEWVLLANYRDVTDLMNSFPFIMGKMEGVAFCSPVRYVEVFMNGAYMGLYQLTEQVEQGKNRVDVADEGGLLLSIDTDDADDTWKYHTQADSMCFWSAGYGLPIGIKYPKAGGKELRDSVKEEFLVLEEALKSGDYDRLDEVLDINSFISILQINELVYNADFPNRSMFLSKDVGGKWRFGPTWDYDAGYSFDYNTQYTSCTFFNTCEGLKINPKRHGSYYNDMFQSERFKQEYVDHWNQWEDSLMTRCWGECMKYVDGLCADNDGLTPFDREFMRWPKHDHSGEHYPLEDIEKMRVWLTDRIEWLTKEINKF